MPFKVGHPKFGGVQKGYVYRPMREIIELALGKSMPQQILEEINQIDKPVERASLLIQLMAYVYPKLKQIDHVTADALDGMTDEQKIKTLRGALEFLEKKHG